MGEPKGLTSSTSFFCHCHSATLSSILIAFFSLQNPMGEEESLPPLPFDRAVQQVLFFLVLVFLSMLLFFCCWRNYVFLLWFILMYFFFSRTLCFSIWYSWELFNYGSSFSLFVFLVVIWRVVYSILSLSNVITTCNLVCLLWIWSMINHQRMSFFFFKLLLWFYTKMKHSRAFLLSTLI